MKYIKKVILENFQSHKYTEMEFDSSLNVIVGPSDQGKSAIIRALKWALYNEPSGDFFIREGERECSVTIIFSDNTKIKRYRSKSKNSYYLYDQYGKEKIFEGFGTQIPQEIVEATSIRKVPLDSGQTSSINIGEQLEGPFLLSEKNSTRANAIGRLVGVHIVDDALKDTLKDIRNLNIKKKSYEETLEVLYVNLEDYAYLEDLINRIKELDEIKQSIYNNRQKLEKLVFLQNDLNKLNNEIKLLEDYLIKLKDIDKIKVIGQKLSQKINRHIYLNNNYNKLNHIETQIKHNSNLLKQLENTSKVENLLENIYIYNNKIDKLYKLSTNYKYTNNSILENKKILIKLKEIQKVQQCISIIEKKILKTEKLLQLNNILNDINKNISIGNIYIDKLAGIEQAIHIKNLLENKLNTVIILENYNNIYKAISKSKLNIEKKLENIKVTLNKNLIKYKDVLSQIEMCPVCFSPIDKLKIDEIIDNYK